MSSYSAQDLETLSLQAAQIEKILQAQKQAQAAVYRQQKEALSSQKEKSLQDAYLWQQQAKTQLPQQLAQNGINGGLAESSQVQLNRTYGNMRGEAQSQYASSLAQLQAQQAEQNAEYQSQAAQNQIDYLGARSALQAAAAKAALAQAAVKETGTADTGVSSAMYEIPAPAELSRLGYSTQEVKKLLKNNGARKNKKNGLIETVF